MQEQQEVLGEDVNLTLTYEKTKQLKVLDKCLKETLRLHPPFILVARKVLNDVKYKNYTIPKGNFVCVSPMLAHRLPDFHSDPEQFNPARFSEDLEGKIPKYAYLPFGGGKHICSGRKFAMYQLKTVISYILNKYKLELVSNQFPKPNYQVMVVGPVQPVTVRYLRK